MRRALSWVTALSLVVSGCATTTAQVVQPAPVASVRTVQVAGPSRVVVATAAPVGTDIPATQFWSGPAGMLVGVALIAAVALGAAAILRN